jgi:serine/threonine-protein kinase
MVMEYLDGSDLGAWLRERGPLPVEQAVEFVLQACEAIAEAHTLGIVHRDLKPGNLFVIRRPDATLSVKVLDFGISKSTTPVGLGSAGAVTRTSALMGSPLYMSPEQMQSARDVDVRSDIWALGVILYELIAGVPPFKAESMPELVLRVVQGPAAPSLRTVQSEVPEGLERVIARCLEKDRRKRYESVGELAVELLPFAPRRSRVTVERISGVLRAAGFSGIATALPPSSTVDELPTGSGTAASWGKTLPPGGRGSWFVVGGAALVAALGAVVWRAQTNATGQVTSGAPGARHELPAAVLPRPATPAAAVTTSTRAVAPLASAVPGPSAATSVPAPPPSVAPKLPSRDVAAKPVATPHVVVAAPKPPAPAQAPSPRSASDKASIFDERK